ncbi:MAG: bifunctional UDP-N-acetylglucosamine diphosphorylase/glucosamine-1-phosphate N-acetyltransferase GlmU [Anaerolineae bacterium]
MNLTIVILAAGEGTRMKSGLPKVMHPLVGRPMLQFVLDAARALEPAQMAMVVGHRSEMIRRALGESLTYVHQEQQLGTGHAVQQAEAVLAGKARTVLVLYGDTPLIRPETLHHMLCLHEAEQAAVTILTFCPDTPRGYGRIVRDAETGRVLAIAEEYEATPEQKAIDEVNSGILCFRDEWLWPNLAQVQRSPGGEFYLTDLVAAACGQGQAVAALRASDPTEVIGVDHRPKLALAEAEMRRRINEGWMLSGVTMIDPATTYIEAGVEIGQDTILWPNTLLQGQTRIGRECIVGPGTVIRDSNIGDGCRVEMSVVEGAVMEDRSDIGPFGHLRQGAHLGEGAHMGNFGEVKNSYLGPGAKMGHFSSLGDATVGAGANIGAGTITCNYDGKRKHQTVIGEGAFIGSDTMLVAPIEIGAGAKTGAGAVVTRDVPPGALAYGVPARVSSPDAGEGAEEA